MGFGQEMKDFIGGFKAGSAFMDDIEEAKDRRAKRDATRKPTDADLEGQPGMGSGTNKVGEGDDTPSAGYDYSDISIEDDPEAAQVLGFIRKYEGGEKDPYNKLVGGGTKPLTSMSVNEVLDFQKDMLRQGHESTAVGAYQFINPTLEGLVKKGVVDPLAPFDQKVQDQLGYALLQGRGWNEYKAGKISKDKLMNNLAGEWAALPLSSGKSAYAGVGSNAAGTSREAFASAVPDFGGGTSDTADAAIPDDTPTAAVTAPAYEQRGSQPAAAPKKVAAAPAIPEEPVYESGAPDGLVAPPGGAPHKDSVNTPVLDTDIPDRTIPTQGVDGLQPSDEQALLEEQMRLYGGVNPISNAYAQATPVLAAAEGGAIPEPRQVDPYNPGRAITVIASSPKPSTSFTPRRVGDTPLPGSTPAPAGGTASQLKFREMQAKAAQPAPVAAPVANTTIAGWGAREGQMPTTANQGQLDKMSDQSLQTMIQKSYASPRSTVRGPQLTSEDLQYARWRLGEEGYQRAVAGAGGWAANYDARQNSLGSGVGGRGRSYARGGAVELPDELDGEVSVNPDQQQSPTAVAAPAPAAPAPVTAIPEQAPEDLPIRDRADPGDKMVAGPEKTVQPIAVRNAVAQALDGGIKFLSDHFGLRQQGGIPEEGGTQVAEAGARRFATGEGAATKEEIQQIDDKIDPDRKMAEGDRQMQRLAKTVQWYQEQGRGKEASAVAASLMQYGAQKFGQLGSMAGAAYKQFLATKDPEHLQATIKYLDRAYEYVPDGASFDIELDPKTHMIRATKKDSDGNTDVHDVKPDELPGIVQGVMNKSLYWKTIYQTADPAGARAKESSAATDARQDKQLAATDRRQAARDDVVDRRQAERDKQIEARADERQKRSDERLAAREKAIQDREDRRQVQLQENREAAARTAAAKNKVDYNSFKPQLAEAEAARKAAEGDGADEMAQDTLNQKASALFDALPETKDRAKIMTDLGYPKDLWQYVTSNPDAAGETPPPAAPAAPAAAPYTPFGATPLAPAATPAAGAPAAPKPAPADADTSPTLPAGAPAGARRDKRGIWVFKTPDGRWGYVKKQ